MAAPSSPPPPPPPSPLTPAPIISRLFRRRIYHLLKRSTYPFSSILGLLLVAVMGWCLDNTINESVFWNPSTDEVKIIESGHMKRFSHIVPKCSFSSGFGFDSKSQDLKLIRFISSFWNSSYELEKSIVELYSWKSDSWKYLDDHPSSFVLRNPSAYVNGCNYWLAHEIDGGSHFVLSFDFASEEFSTLSLPCVGNGNGKTLGRSLHFDFVEFHGSLGVIVFPKLGTEKTFELWLSNGSDPSSWTKAFDVRVPGAERPLGFWKNGRLLFLEGINRQLMVHDMIKLDIYDYPGKMQLVPYVETQFSIRGASEEKEKSMVSTFL